MTDSRPPSLGQGRWLVPLPLLYAGPFLVYGDRFAIPPLLAAISRDFDRSLGAVATVASAYFLLYGVMQLPYGLLSDRVGRVRVMRIALAGMGLANAASAAAPSLAPLVVSKAATAGLAAAVLPTSLVYIGDQVAFDRRQRIIANVLAAGALGTVLATVGAGLLANAEAWRVVFVVPAVLALALGWALGRLPESHSAEPGGGPVTQLRRVFSRPWAVFVIGLAVAEGAVMVGMLPFLPPALEAHGHSAAVAGLVVATYGLAVVAGMQLVKRYVRRTALTPAAMVALGGGLLVVAYLAAALDQGIAGILSASVLIGLGYCFLHSTLQTWATDVAPHARGTAISLFVTGVFTGAAVGSWAVSGLAGAGRFSVLFLIAAALTVPVLLVGTFARRRYPASEAG